MAWDDDIKGPGGIRYGVWIPRDPNYVKKQEPKAPEPPKAPANDWIKIKVVDDQSGEVIPKVKLSIKTPDNSTEDHETRLSGLIESLGLQSGNCEVFCDLKDATLENILSFTGVGESPIRKKSTDESNSNSDSAKGAGKKYIASIEEHKVKTGETLEKLARSVGMSSNDLANFNWKTTNPDEIEKHLAHDVGCTKKSADGKYLFDDSDQPGVVYLPKKWKKEGLSTNQVHTVRVAQFVPAAAVGQLTITAPANNTQLVIDATPQMPEIDVQVAVSGLTPDEIASAVFEWTAQIRFNPRTDGCRHGPNRNFAMDVSGQHTGGEFQIQFPRIMGGNLTITVKATISGRELSATTTGLTIAATNPTRAVVQAEINDDILQRIACVESRQRQFDAAPGAVTKCPYWSQDNLGGVGLFQITRPSPTDEEVWNWKVNAATGRNRFAEKRRMAVNYRSQIQNSRTFTALVNQINAERATSKSPPITVSIPPLSAEQIEDDSIRAFNGYGDQHDQFGLNLHEFRLVMDGQQLRVHINETTLTGTTEWERVPVNQRGPSGDLDYVNHVRNANPACGG